MLAFRWAIVSAVLVVLSGCGVQLKHPGEQKLGLEKQEQERKLSSMPTIEYRPGG
jgi:hypothetical protein